MLIILKCMGALLHVQYYYVHMTEKREMDYQSLESKAKFFQDRTSSLRSDRSSVSSLTYQI